MPQIDVSFCSVEHSSSLTPSLHSVHSREGKPSLHSFLSSSLPLLPRWVLDLPRALAVEGFYTQGERAQCLGVHISDPTYPFSWGPLFRVQPGLGSQGEGG